MKRRRISLLRTVIFIIMLAMTTTVSALSQTQKTYNTWEEAFQGINNGEKEAASFFVDIKNQIETSKEWTKNIKDSYFAVIRVLTEYYSNSGYYKEQEGILIDAIKLFNQRDSIANTSYTRMLWASMMKFQFDIKNFDSALNYGHQALSMYEEANDYGINYCILCLNIGSAYLEKGDIVNAKLYVDKAADTMQELSNKGISEDFVYYFMLNLKGLIYNKLKQYDKSIECFKEVIEHTSSNTIGSPYDLALNNLANSYFMSGHLDEAIKLLKGVGSLTPDLRYFKAQNLSMAYFLNRDYDQASIYLHEYNTELYNNATHVIANFSEVEREAYLTKRNREAIFVNNMIASKSRSSLQEAFDINLYARMISLAINRNLKSYSKGKTDRLQLDSLRQALITKNIAYTTVDSIRRKIVEVEKHLLGTDSTLLQNIAHDIGSFKEVANLLGNKEALVLFCYVPIMEIYPNLEAHYGAFVIRKGDKYPKLVLLGGVDNTESIFYNVAPTVEFISNLYNEKNAKALYKLLWEPLERHLKGATCIYYSTVGPLSTINFDALMNSKGHRLRERKNLVMLSSPMEKGKLKAMTAKAGDFLAFGAPTFNLSKQEMIENAIKHKQYSGMDISRNLLFRGERMRGNWQDLPGTRKEIESILPFFSKDSINVFAYFGKDANEEAVKEISGNSPHILHIATHGFVISTSEQYKNSNFAQSVSSISEKNNYMLWAGLVLSGGNNTWSGERIPNGVEDGILTADEISRLDLSNTDLVVLSACETARGHMDPVEGVWGLQRAFKQAGVKTILMTLWKVSDDITSMFMREFYRSFLNGETVRQSVKKAQDYLIKNGATDPFYWAPFVALD